ncbi:MutS-related protein [Lichenibacterium dinghuense]|uniref:MutS-related protein n=1 Tax=Lichenibacterium dinghuense TaxID=2895977 RepID=UPI001F1DB60D|nr:DNA mismatch repair protein MutS [Lichenibacterium sp. 6Y81]
MQALLLHPDRDFDWKRPDPPGTGDLVRDLGLSTLVEAMAKGDERLREAARGVLLAGTADLATIRHRQDVVRDCLAHPDLVRDLYALTIDAIETERKSAIGAFFRSPGMVLSRSIELMGELVAHLRRLRIVAEEQGPSFRSQGFGVLFSTVRRELGERYLAEVNRSLGSLKFPGGMLMSARLGSGNAGRDYTLRRADLRRDRLLHLLGRGPEGYDFTLAPRDESGARALSELRDRGVEVASGAVARSVEHVVDFFKMLRAELAFCVGALNLHEALAASGCPTCLPDPRPPGNRSMSARNLCDASLALSLGHGIVGNALAADGKDLLVVTGANRGGKSTFLRSLGQAAVMMRCGLFVAADAFAAEVPERVFTHHRREEDASLRSGKFDEELARMSGIADALVPNSLVLFNESFSATNEREGSEVARQIVSALLARGVRIVFVTHQYTFARGFHERGSRATLFLRAGRDVDGGRNFAITEADPLPTSYGPDLFARIFDEAGPIAGKGLPSDHGPSHGHVHAGGRTIQGEPSRPSS